MTTTADVKKAKAEEATAWAAVQEARQKRQKALEAAEQALVAWRSVKTALEAAEQALEGGK